jgi:hypothetical protein
MSIFGGVLGQAFYNSKDCDLTVPPKLMFEIVILGFIYFGTD